MLSYHDGAKGCDVNRLSSNPHLNGFDDLSCGSVDELDARVRWSHPECQTWSWEVRESSIARYPRFFAGRHLDLANEGSCF